jgi:hypothetical protein
LGASPCKAKELYRDKKLLPHFAYENAATSFLLLLLLFKSLFIFLFLTTFFYTGDFRFLKSGATKTDFFSVSPPDRPFSFTKQTAIEHRDNLIDRKASARSRLQICVDSPQDYVRPDLSECLPVFLIGTVNFS